MAHAVGGPAIPPKPPDDPRTTADSGLFTPTSLSTAMSPREPTYRTLRLLCANGAGMVGFLAAFAVAGEFTVALVAGLIVATIGYVASSAVVEYASG